MPKKQTKEELQAKIKRYEEYLEKQKKALSKLTTAEEKKINGEVVKTVKDWVNSLPKEKRPEWSEVPALLKNKLGIEIKEEQSQPKEKPISAKEKTPEYPPGFTFF